MDTRYRLSTCLLPLMLLAACASDPRPSASSAKERDPSFWCVPKLPAGIGRIWIYRTAPKGIGIPPDIVVNNRNFGALRHGTAYMLDVPPGKYDVKLDYLKDKLEIEIKEGEEAFVRFAIDPALRGRGIYPVAVARQAAQVEIHEHTRTDFSCVSEQLPN